MTFSLPQRVINFLRGPVVGRKRLQPQLPKPFIIV